MGEKVGPAIISHDMGYMLSPVSCISSPPLIFMRLLCKESGHAEKAGLGHPICWVCSKHSLSRLYSSLIFQHVCVRINTYLNFYT